MPKAKAKPKRKLKNLTVEYISLVDSGANKREVIYKNADADQQGEKVKKQITFRKTDDDQRLVYGVVYAPGEVDAHGDTMDVEDIAKAAHEFLASGKTSKVDKQHDNNADKGFVVESALLKGENHPLFPDDPEGTWVVTIKVTDDETWKEIKKGSIKGISMEGFAEAEDLEEETAVEKAEFIVSEIKKYFEEKIPGIKKLFKQEDMTNDQGPSTKFAEVMKSLEGKTEEEFAAIEKSFNDALIDNQVRQAIYALESSSYAIMRNDEIEDKKAALAANAQEFIDHINGLNVSKSENQTTEDESMSEPTKPAAPVEKSEEVEKSPELLAIEKLTESITGIDERLKQVEKAAGTSQADAGQDDPNQTQIKKSALGIFPGIQ